MEDGRWKMEDGIVNGEKVEAAKRLKESYDIVEKKEKKIQNKTGPSYYRELLDVKNFF